MCPTSSNTNRAPNVEVKITLVGIPMEEAIVLVADIESRLHHVSQNLNQRLGAILEKSPLTWDITTIVKS